MELLKNSLRESLQDFVMSRSERKQIRRELEQARLDDHQKQVLWSEELLLAHRLGKDIRIITDNDKTADLGSDIDRLALAGIKVVEDRTSVHMHHKFALFDDDYLLTGSYNWTRSAADHNYENVIMLQDAKAFKAYEREFERLWGELG